MKATRLVLSVLNPDVHAVSIVFKKDNGSFSYHTVGNTNIQVRFRISLFLAKYVLVTARDSVCDAVQSGT